MSGDATTMDVLRPALDARANSYQNFIGAFRRFWAGPLYRHVRDQARALPHQGAQEFSAFESELAALPAYQVFAWLEHNLQRMKYCGAHGMVPTIGAQRARLEAELARPLPEGLLTEAPDLAMPHYYRETDFHQHPGGLGGDLLAGVIYRESAGAPGGVVGKEDLHARFVRDALEGEEVDRVLDVGCGFGRSTVAFVSSGPRTSGVGIDLSQGCLRLAAHLACGRPEQQRLRFVQADAAAVPFGDGSFDLVTSTMLLHELPGGAIREITAEAYRLLRPHGRVVHLDFLPPGDNFLRALYFGHSERNAEPHMQDLAGMDLVAEHETAGFTDVEIRPFAESDSSSDDRWRLPWVIVSARKPA